MDFVRTAVVSLACLAAFAGCYNSLDPSNVSCRPGRERNCPVGYECRVVGASSVGRCCRPSDRTCAVTDASGTGADAISRQDALDSSLVEIDAISENPDTPIEAPLEEDGGRTGAGGHPGSTGGVSSDVGAGVGGASGAAGGIAAGGVQGRGGAGGSGAGGTSSSIDAPLGTGGDNPSGGAAGQGGTGGGASAGNGGTGGLGSGGVSPGTGGALATGGTVGTGGLPATGGSAASGGAPGTGGSPGTGGTVTGGTPGTGGASTCGQGGSAPPNSLTVDVDAAQSVVNRELFGVLMERLGRGIKPGLFVGTASSIPNVNGMRKDIIDGLKEAGVGAIQFPGGCAANGYLWSANTNTANDVGTDRFMELCSLVGAEPYITGRPTSGDASSNAAWVDYIRGHADWNLKYFKVGSDVWGCAESQTEATYETSFTTNYNALNSKDLFLVAAGGQIGNQAWAWAESIVNHIGGLIAGIELHDYLYFPDAIPSAGFTVDQYYKIVYLANAGQIHPHIDRMIQSLDAYDPAKRIKIVIDEWGDWLGHTGDGWAQQNTVMDAISAAEQLHLFIEHADRIQLAALSQAINVIHSLFLTNSADLMVKTPTFYIFKMFIPHHTAGAKSAPKTLVSEDIVTGAGTLPVLSAGATVDTSGRVNVSLVNVDLESSRSILITLSGSKTSYAVSSARIVTGPAMDSTNNFGQPETVNIQPLAQANYSACGKSARVTLPPKSVVMLAIDPQP